MIRHVLREALFKPEIVKPAHGHQVAEPLVRQLMQQQDVAVQPVAVRGRGAEQDRLFAQERGARVLHAPISEARNHHHVVFGKRERLGKVVRQVLRTVGGDLLYRFRLSLGFFKFRFADIKAGQARSFMHLPERSRRKGEQISADGSGFGEHRVTHSLLAIGFVLSFVSCRLGSVGDDLPIRWGEHIQRESCFQVRLIEARKGHVGIHRHKQRVDVLAAVVLVFKARDGLARRGNRRGEIDLHHVFLRLEQLCRKLDVAILDRCRSGLAVDAQAADRALAKIQP